MSESDIPISNLMSKKSMDKVYEEVSNFSELVNRYESFEKGKK